MRNFASIEHVVPGKVYMVEMKNGKAESYRVLTETPTHYILSFSKDGGVEVFDQSKENILGIYEIKEWLENQENE